MLEHCRDGSPFSGALSSDRIPKMTNDEMNLWDRNFPRAAIPVIHTSEFREIFEDTTYYFVGLGWRGWYN